MTQNQIEYWKLQESLRHNQAVEEETERAARAQLAETKRANRAKEKETQRSNLSRESISLAEAGVGMERNRIEQERTRNQYELGQLDYYLRGNYNDRYFDLANAQLQADINRANLQYRSSIYGADASKLVGLTNAEYNREVSLTRAANELALGQEQNRIAKTRADNDFILGASRNKTQRDYNRESLGLQAESNVIRREEYQNRAMTEWGKTLAGVGRTVAGMN